MIRQLTTRQAWNCENAKNPACKCRCGGAFHGAARGGNAEEPERDWFETLPADDPHKLLTDEEKRVRRNLMSRAKRQRAREERNSTPIDPAFIAGE